MGHMRATQKMEFAKSPEPFYTVNAHDALNDNKFIFLGFIDDKKPHELYENMHVTQRSRTFHEPSRDTTGRITTHDSLERIGSFGRLLPVLIFTTY